MKSLRLGPVLLGLSVLGACDVPTDPPMVEQRWILPMENTRISVEEFLPDGVSLLGNLFAVAIEPFSTESTLGELCASCTDGPGTTPAFEGTLSGSQPFPEEVLGATVESGAVAVAVQNGFSFDPTAGGGSVVITITDGPGGKLLGQATISTALAPGSTVTRAITLAGGSVGPNIMASTVVTSPGGQATTIDTSDRLVIDIEVVSLMVSFATVEVAGRTVDLEPNELDVSDIDDTITDHIESGTILLDVTNPFGVALSVDLVIEYPGGTVSKTVDIEGTAVSSTSIPYTGDELRSFLGQEGVTLTGTGSISGAAGPVTLRTDLDLILDASIDLTLIIG